MLGSIASFGLAPYNVFVLTIFCLVISLFILDNIEKPREAFSIGFSYGLGFHIFSLYWIAISFKVANFGGYYLGFFAVFLLCSFLAIFSAASFYFFKKLSKKNNLLSKSILIILIFSIFDWIKGNILWGFPWTPIASIWTFNQKFLVPFSYLGVWGYSMITYSIIAGIYVFKKNIKLSIILMTPFILIFLVSSFRFKKNEYPLEELNVRLVQPNIKQVDKWNIDKTKANLERLIKLTLKDGVKDLDLVIWPETAVLFNIEDNNEYNFLLKEKLKPINNLILGSIRRDNSFNKVKIYNSLFLISNHFRDINFYDKNKLVPFGEFIPFRNFLSYKNITLGGVDFSAGKKIKLLNIKNNIKLLPLICYEIIFPKITNANNNYNLIVNITNDAWFGSSRGPYQHLALSRIRAVLEGKYIFRVANTGITTIIDHNGNLLEKIDLNKSGVINKKLVLYKKNTLYNYAGNNIFYILLVLLIIVFLTIKYKGIKGNYD